MKLKCSRGRLHEALSLATMVVPQRTTIPAVMNVKFTATKKGKSGGLLELACTDLERADVAVQLLMWPHRH